MPENKVDEQDILNFALNLEYLEAEFYTCATTGKSITTFGIGTKGRASGSNPTAGGTTVGGTQVTFSEEERLIRDIATQIGRIRLQRAVDKCRLFETRHSGTRVRLVLESRQTANLRCRSQ